MNYKKLGNTNIEVSTICLGTMTWGEQNTQEEAFEQMDYALDMGVNFWDTAELYSVPPKKETYGHTEVIIGNWFKKSNKREKVILATKVAGPMREYLRGGGNNYGIEKMTEAINSIEKMCGLDNKSKMVKDSHVTQTMRYLELLKELKKSGNKDKKVI